jgi:hypothetical protein
MNKVVARCLDNRCIKGFAFDFGPNKDLVHIADQRDSKQITEIPTSELKAVFFVKTFEGNPRHESPDFSKESLTDVPGTKLKVTFTDGEVMYGTTNGYSATRPGFFLIPVDKTGNNIRAYVYRTATESVEAWT